MSSPPKDPPALVRSLPSGCEFRLPSIAVDCHDGRGSDGQLPELRQDLVKRGVVEVRPSDVSADVAAERW